MRKIVLIDLRLSGLTWICHGTLSLSLLLDSSVRTVIANWVARFAPELLRLLYAHLLLALDLSMARDLVHHFSPLIASKFDNFRMTYAGT